MAEVHHFAYGWINPILSFVLSFLGSLLGLVLVVRSRDSRGGVRLWWLSLAAVAIGGTGIWLMHFMAMLGFDVPAAVLRYDVTMTVLSFVIAVVIVALGLYAVGFGRPAMWKILAGGVFTGSGIAAMHYTGMAAVHLAGHIDYDPGLVALSVVVAIVTACIALWCVVSVKGAGATIGAAVVMGSAVCGMHYIAMAAVRVELVDVDHQVRGVGPFALLTPIIVLACVVVSALAFATVGFSIRQEHVEEEAALALARQRSAASLDRVPRHGAALAAAFNRPGSGGVPGPGTAERQPGTPAPDLAQAPRQQPAHAARTRPAAHADTQAVPRVQLVMSRPENRAHAADQKMTM